MSAKFLGGGGATKGVKIERKLKASAQRTMRSSIIRNEDQLDTLTENVPKHRIFPILDTEKPHVSFIGPAENSEEQIGLPYACGQSISTYPMLPKGRMGEPICDAVSFLMTWQMTNDDVVRRFCLSFLQRHYYR
jgi:hypothetical protein